jgi:hypothetical protein
MSFANPACYDGFMNNSRCLNNRPHATGSKGICLDTLIWTARISDVLAWLGPEASGFGLALSGFGFQDPQAKP